MPDAAEMLSCFRFSCLRPPLPLIFLIFPFTLSHAFAARPRHAACRLMPLRRRRRDTPADVLR